MCVFQDTPLQFKGAHTWVGYFARESLGVK